MSSSVKRGSIRRVCISDAMSYILNIKMVVFALNAILNETMMKHPACGGGGHSKINLNIPGMDLDRS